MSSDTNLVVQIGRLTRDAELKYTTTGAPVCNFSIAVNDVYTSNGQKTEYVSYFEVNLWGKVAEALIDYLKKGKRVAITGKLKQERWNDQGGGVRSKVKINCQTIQLLSPKNQGNQNNPGPQQGNDGFQDEIPF